MENQETKAAEKAKEEMQLEKAINRMPAEIMKLNAMDDYFLEKMGMTAQQLSLLQSWYPGISAAEIMFATEFQKEYELSIMKKEIELVKRGAFYEISGKKEWVEKYVPMVNAEGKRSAARKICERTGKTYRPSNTGYKIGESARLVNGNWEKCSDLIAWSEIKLENGDVSRVEVCFIEEAQWTKEKKDKAGNVYEPARLTTFWANRPLLMLQKVADSRNHTKVYGVNIPASEERQLEKVDYIESLDTTTQAEKQTQVKDALDAMKKLANPTEAEVVKEPAESTDAPFDADPDTGEIAMTDFEKELARAEISKDEIVGFFKDAKNKIVNFEDVNTSPAYFDFRQDVMTNNNAQMTKLLNYKKAFTATKK